MEAMAKHRKATGFSLIEVLVSVVVLSFGILALTALQSNLIKASADAKAQSVALALAKDRLEKMRAFSTIPQYLAITSGSDTINDTNGGLGGVTGNLGGLNFTRSWTVKRYATTVGSSTFTEYANLTGALPNTYAPNREFKTAQVTVRWADASGQNQYVVIEDAIAGLDPNDSTRLQRSSGSRSRGPKVIIFDPSSDPGVIPIAVGNGSDTAATNPKPVVAAQTSGEDTIETRFDVLTYSALTGGKALAQAKVETTVVGCTCSSNSTSTPGYRPTYWNGLRYVPPQSVTYASSATPASGATQSRYCTECCRDHRDPGSVAGAKFSPRRPTHTHYKGKDTAGNWVAAGPGENYLEACRLIRVDGIFDVAADLSDDYMNLLDTGTGTADSQFGNDPAPNPSAVQRYQLFVLDYLQQRYAPATASTDSSSAPLLHAYNQRCPRSPCADASAVSPNSIAATGVAPPPVSAAYNLQTPRGVRRISAANDQRWLHTRGIYIDFLEKEALDAIGDARSNCQDGPDAGTTVDSSEIRDCILRVLPFTTINLTELAAWSPVAGASIKVSNAYFDDSPSNPDPVRGLVVPVGGTTPENANARASSSNSGVAIAPDIDPDDEANAQVATQPFEIQGGSATPGGQFKFGTSATYAINNASPRTLDFYYGSNASREFCSVSGTDNPVVCKAASGETLPAVVKLQVGNYNKIGSDSVDNPCDNGKENMPYVIDFDITGFTSSNPATQFTDLTVINPDRPGAPLAGGEYTTVIANQIAAATPAPPATPTSFDTITANVGTPTYLCPSNYPDMTARPEGDSSYACHLSGNKLVPQWTTTYVACPSSAGSPPDFH